MNTDYSLREYPLDELREAFGSLGRCLEVTGGDVAVVCFFMHNRDKIHEAKPTARLDTSRYAQEIRDAWLIGRAPEIYRERQSLTAVQDELHISRDRARVLLGIEGKAPRKTKDGSGFAEWSAKQAAAK